VNRQHQRSAGHLWQGRYYSCPLDNRHLSAALLYVERNPVRAGLVRSPAAYQWSSAAARLGHVPAADYLSLYLWAASYTAEEWALLLDEGISAKQEDDLRASTKQGKPFGDMEFVEELEERTHRDLRLRAVGRPALGVQAAKS
jgi:putative transposase